MYIIIWKVRGQDRIRRTTYTVESLNSLLLSNWFYFNRIVLYIFTVKHKYKGTIYEDSIF
jgi:hypothetical protein